MDNIKVTKIRPVSWKIVVQGLEQAQYVRKSLAAIGLETTECEKEPALVEPELFAFIATPHAETPITSEELKVALQNDERVEFELSQ